MLGEKPGRVECRPWIGCGWLLVGEAAALFWYRNLFCEISGLKMHVSPGRQLVAIYHSCAAPALFHCSASEWFTGLIEAALKHLVGHTGKGGPCAKRHGGHKVFCCRKYHNFPYFYFILFTIKL